MYYGMQAIFNKRDFQGYPPVTKLTVNSKRTVVKQQSIFHVLYSLVKKRFLILYNKALYCDPTGVLE